MNIAKQKQTHRYREQTSIISGEREERKGKIAVGDWKTQTTIYKINKLQGYIVQHREYSQYLIINLNGV